MPENYKQQKPKKNLDYKNGVEKTIKYFLGIRLKMRRIYTKNEG